MIPATRITRNPVAMSRNPVATGILVGLAVLAACLGALWLVLAVGVGLAG